jgi:uncharacterized protein (TIGR02466 family)
MIENKHEILPVFPEAIIYTNQLILNSKEVINYLDNLNFRQINKEDYICYISENLNIFNDLSFLKKKIEPHIKNYLYNILSLKMDYKFLNSWATRASHNEHDERHVHRNTFLSGVYYPLGNKDFKIKFYRNKSDFWNIEKKENNFFNTREIILNIVEDNTLLLFPSDLEHSIVKNNSETTRYSIAFNINPKGYIGENDTKVFF